MHALSYCRVTCFLFPVKVLSVEESCTGYIEIESRYS